MESKEKCNWRSSAHTILIALHCICICTSICICLCIWVQCSANWYISRMNLDGGRYKEYIAHICTLCACNSVSTIFGQFREQKCFGHCLQFNFSAVHYAQQLSSTTEYKCNTKLCAFQLNAISWNSAECFSSIINTIQRNRMKWKRVYHIREFQHFSGIECNGLHLQCLAQHLSAFRVESPTMRSTEHCRVQITAEHGREQLLRGGDRSVLSGSRHTGILAAPAAIPCAQYHAIPRNTSMCNII